MGGAPSRFGKMTRAETWMCCLRSGPQGIGTRRSSVRLTASHALQGETPPAAEDHSQTLNLLLQQLPWHKAGGLDTRVVSGELLPAVSMVLNTVVSHCQDARGVPSVLLSVARILAVLIDR